MEILKIRNKPNLTVKLTETHAYEIEEYLKALELIEYCPVKTMAPNKLETYRPKEQKLRDLDEDAVEVMCAKHVLWHNDEGGEQADFSNCLAVQPSVV